MALPLTKLDYNPQPVASVSKNSENKSLPPNVPSKFTPGTWVFQLLFLQVSGLSPGETENASNICLSIPFLHSLQPEHSRSSTFEGYENNSGFLWEKNLEENQANSRWKQTFAIFIMHTGILPDNTCSVRFYCPWLLHRSWGWLSSRTPWSHPSASSLSREFLEVALSPPGSSSLEYPLCYFWRVKSYPPEASFLHEPSSGLHSPHTPLLPGSHMWYLFCPVQPDPQSCPVGCLLSKVVFVGCLVQ